MGWAGRTGSPQSAGGAARQLRTGVKVSFPSQLLKAPCGFVSRAELHLERAAGSQCIGARQGRALWDEGAFSRRQGCRKDRKKTVAARVHLFRP